MRGKNMTRMTREARQACTRAALLAAATHLFGRYGYAATSVDRIAEQAGFSKGAVYSNFDSKEAIFLAVLDEDGGQALDLLVTAIEAAADARAVVDLLADWANERSHSGIWSLTILEHARLAGADAPSLAHQRAILRRHWLRLGSCVVGRLPALAGEGEAGAETLGALLHEIAYAPALTFMDRPAAGDLMRLALGIHVGAGI
jgi:AcrR family transcriptional regulator